MSARSAMIALVGLYPQRPESELEKATKAPPVPTGDFVGLGSLLQRVFYPDAILDPHDYDPMTKVRRYSRKVLFPRVRSRAIWDEDGTKVNIHQQVFEFVNTRAIPDKPRVGTIVLLSALRDLRLWPFVANVSLVWRGIKTRVDLLCEDQNGRLVVVQISAERELELYQPTVMDPPLKPPGFEDLREAPSTRDQLRLLATKIMLENILQVEGRYQIIRVDERKLATGTFPLEISEKAPKMIPLLFPKKTE